MKSETRDYRTGDREVVLDITDDCAGFVVRRGRRAAPASSCRTPPPGSRSSRPAPAPTTTCWRRSATCCPADDRWRHRHGSPGHGRSHVMPALVPPYATVPVLDGRLALGTWQSICLVDLNVDNPDRQVRFSFLAG